MVARHVAADADPLHGHGDGHAHRAGGHEQQARDKPRNCQAIGVEYPQESAEDCGEQHRGGHRREEAEGFHRAARYLDAQARVIGEGLAAVDVRLDAAHALRWGAPPVGTGLGLLRRRGEHGHERILAQLAAGARDAGVAHKRALAHLSLAGEQPAAAELVTAHERVIREERAVLDLGELRNHDGGGNLRVAANACAERAQPARCELGGVEREERRAGFIHEPFDAPCAPATRRAHRRHAGLES